MWTWCSHMIYRIWFARIWFARIWFPLLFQIIYDFRYFCIKIIYEQSHVHIWALIYEHSYMNTHIWTFIYDHSYVSTHMCALICEHYLLMITHESWQYVITYDFRKSYVNNHMWTLICEHSYVITHMWTMSKPIYVYSYDLLYDDIWSTTYESQRTHMDSNIWCFDRYDYMYWSILYCRSKVEWLGALSSLHKHFETTTCWSVLVFWKLCSRHKCRVVEVGPYSQSRSSCQACKLCVFVV